MSDSAEGKALSGAVRGRPGDDVLHRRDEREGGAPGVLRSRHWTRGYVSQGARSGEFRVAVAPAAARSVACNFLGAEDESEITETQVGDVICELANMICGSALSRLSGDLAFDLSHPELDAGDGDLAGWPETAAHTFDLKDGWLTAAIRFE